MICFDTPDHKVVWIEPNYVASVEPASYIEKGNALRVTKINTLVGPYIVLDPNQDVGKTLAAAKANHAGEISTIVHALSRYGRDKPGGK